MIKFAIIIKQTHDQNLNKIKEIIINNNFSFVYTKNVLEADLLFIFGGDGFFIQNIKKFLNLNIKCILVNTGQLGFLSSIENINNYKFNLEQDFNNFYYLEANVFNNNIKASKKYIIINEMQIKTNKISSSFLSIDNDEINKIKLLSSNYIIVNSLGSSGIAKSFNLPLITKNLLNTYYFFCYSQPFYKYNSLYLNQPILFKSDNILKLDFKKNKNYLNFALCIDGKNNIINQNINKIIFKQRKSKLQILNISLNDHLFWKINKNF